MPTAWNDNNASIKANGNLSLGGGGVDDAAYDATYTYAKRDFELEVPASLLISTTLPALTQSGGAGDGNPFIRALAASTTHHVQLPILDFLRTYTTTPHGLLIYSASLVYRVNTTTLTSATMGLYSMPLAAATTQPTPTTIVGTVAGNTLTAAANLYEMKFTVTTPAWITTTGTLVWGDIDIVTPGSSTCDLYGAIIRGSVALY